MHGLLHRLVDDALLQAQQRADAGGLRGAQMGDVVDLVLVQADGAHQVDLDLIAGGDAADQLGAGFSQSLRDGKDWWNVVAGMRVIGGEEGVVHVEFAHRDPVGPGGPFRCDSLRRRHAKDGCAVRDRARQGHVARRNDGMAVGGCDRHGCVVDDPVDDHARHVAGHLDRIGGHAGDFPGELVVSVQAGL